MSIEEQAVHVTELVKEEVIDVPIDMLFQAVLDALDKLLIPTTSNAELKQLLVDVRPAIAAHLEHAKKLQSVLVASK